jgi:predicted nucleotidyltransferase
MTSGLLQAEFAIPVPTDRLAAFCDKWGLCRLELFGSILRDDFKPESDVDVLVSLREGIAPTFMGMLDMKEELESLFARRVDLLRRQAVEVMRNSYRRNSILNSAAVVYAD